MEFVERVDAVKDKMSSIGDYFVIDGNDYKGWEKLDDEVNKFPSDNNP